MNTSSRVSTDIDAASSILTHGGIVAIPTETVYGLAAIALNETAVGRVFSTKGRPTSHPLIVHLSPNDDYGRWGVLNEAATSIAAAIWPGPITLLVPRTRLVPDWVTGGRDTVALRVPAHDMTLSLLKQLGDAVVAPSANRFGQVSPTRAEHVLADLGEDVDLILDGGPCEIGIESTIIECTSNNLQILRPGKITAVHIAEITGLQLAHTDGPSRAPGMMIAHYAPKARVELCASLAEASEKNSHYKNGGISSCIVHHEDPAEYALSVYDDLRAADTQGAEVVLAVMPPDHGIGKAIRDRLTKAAAG
ncbi:MAG: threonylcarbamoyl-AMP synthase [Actinobacteria bacterium]|uniref:Threonylcarbamoyl-AMP synthase n=1 Tax=freshwater metagenome TaxID=449393 RepID=A0A6J7TKY7_9ZZZZ|nr:threonylcarbamoyl-AMP synthase [Actinomycetota bacterium]